ncbi:MAG: hypothetical protein IPN34_13575 [Planctomycetes bacterium]|nr:hypothetical protein [Planctomycetota bacterium]
MRFLRTFALLLLAALPAAPLAAQTTGFPFVNDLTVNGSIPGSTSCNLVNSTALPHTYQITAAPLSPCVLFFSLCPCQAGALPLPPATCPFPMTQSLDLMINPACFVIPINGATNGAGVFSITFPASTVPFTFSVQAAVVDICGTVSLTQAYDVWI